MIPVILEVAISLIVIYFLLSTVVSFINEIIALIISSRGKLLRESIRQLLVDNQNSDLVTKIYDNHHINKLRIFSWIKPQGYLPANIPAEHFSSSLLETIGSIHVTNQMDLQNAIASISNEPLKNKLTLLLNQLDGTQQDLHHFKQKIEEWYNLQMNIVSEVYRLRSRVVVFCISLVVCIWLNINSINLANYYYHHKEQREMMVKFADRIEQDQFTKIDNTLADSAKYKLLIAQRNAVMDSVKALEIPIGDPGKILAYSTTGKFEIWATLLRIFGILISVCCLTMGAPFWFDMMKKLAGLRKQI
ncbi:MAG: hypothetical protein IPK62_14225 [Bacteroidetes bacterium]|nr:hypothetical protein [Bacteroidota bacterium]